MSKPDFEAAKEYVLERLEKELPRNLFYHGIYHTKDDVLPSAERLAEMEGLSKEDLLLLRTAALYHDIGYIEQYKCNEDIAVRIASEILPDFGYSSEQIGRIGQIIMATKMEVINGNSTQSPDPDDLLQKLMCDADLDSLGREDYLVLSGLLLRELVEYGVKIEPEDWVRRQVKLLENHSYFTESAKSLRNEGKQGNIRVLREILDVIESKK